MPSEPLFDLVGRVTTLLIAIGKSAFGGGLAILGIPLLAIVADPLDGSARSGSSSGATGCWRWRRRS